MDDHFQKPDGTARGASLPATVFGYVLRFSGPHQLGLAALSTLVFLLSAAPLELQRRIVNDAIRDGASGVVIALAIGYVGVAFLEGGLKYIMNMYRGWVKIGRAHV